MKKKSTKQSNLSIDQTNQNSRYFANNQTIQGIFGQKKNIQNNNGIMSQSNQSKQRNKSCVPAFKENLYNPSIFGQSNNNTLQKSNNNNNLVNYKIDIIKEKKNTSSKTKGSNTKNKKETNNLGNISQIQKWQKTQLDQQQQQQQQLLQVQQSNFGTSRKSMKHSYSNSKISSSTSVHNRQNNQSAINYQTFNNSNNNNLGHQKNNTTLNNTATYFSQKNKQNQAKSENNLEGLLQIPGKSNSRENSELMIRHNFNKIVQPKASFSNLQIKGQQSEEKSSGKNKKLKITQLKSIKPTNLEEQKIIFFEKNFDYNPQFQYISDNLNLAIQKAHEKYIDLALKILNQVQEHYGSIQKYWESQGNFLDKEQTEKKFQDYIESLGLQNHIQVCYQENCVSTTTCSHNPNGTAKIIVGLPIKYREGRIQGVLNHEIGTHFLRKYNNQFQKWSKKRKPYQLQPYMKIEEGLACLNTHIHQAQDPNQKPFMFHAALHYYAQYQSSKMSFSELFKDLEKYLETPEERWRECIRVKRGITDTALHQGQYKDSIYLRGAIKVLKYRNELDFIKFHQGKITVKDCLKLTERKMFSNNEKLKNPQFLEDMQQYKKALNIIAETNFIE